MVNDKGGIGGRTIEYITYDDAYSPPKGIEQASKLVESDEVLLIFQPLGTPSNSAIMKYMNAKKVPQLFVASGGTKFGDPKNFPWTMGFQPNYQSEGRIYAKYIKDNFPNSKIAVLWQNDDAGKDQFKGLKDGLGDKLSMIIADKSYEVSDDHAELVAEAVLQALELILSGVIVLPEHRDLAVREIILDVFGVDSPLALVVGLKTHGPGEVLGIAE